MIYDLLFIFLHPVLTFSYSVCLSWRGPVSTCILLLLSSPDEKKKKKSRRARKQRRLGCCAQNLLSKHFEDHIFPLRVNIREYIHSLSEYRVPFASLCRHPAIY